MRTREGLKIAKAKGRLRGKQPKLSKIQSKHLLELYTSGEYTTAELAELFSVSRATLLRAHHSALLESAALSHHALNRPAVRTVALLMRAASGDERRKPCRGVSPPMVR